MPIRTLTDKSEIESFFRPNPGLHIYSIGDLDDFFWPRTIWYGRGEAGKLSDVVLVYRGPALPTLIAVSQQPTGMQELLREIIPLLPQSFYAHLSLGVEDIFGNTHQLHSHGLHYKMVLRNPSHVTRIDGSQAARLGQQDLSELIRLHQESYPGNWFDPRMVETGQYFGLRAGGRLVSAAGVHVYSERYRVAAIGNVVTHPAHRNRGYGKLVTARLCQSLLEKVEHVGLNVKADNKPTLACYGKLGFAIIAPYAEFTIGRRLPQSMVRPQA